MKRRVVVVGAGLAGLTAARRLQQAGFEVQVLEAQDQPGGRMGQRRSGPIAYNTGARLIYPFGRTLHALIDEVGLRDAMLPLRGLGATCRHPQGDYRVELMPGLATLRTPGLGWRDKLGLLRSAAALLGWRPRTDPDLAASALAADDITLADYIRRSASPAVLERLVEPVFRGTRSWNADEISAAFYLSTTPHLIGQDTVYTLRDGMGQLTRRLAEDLPVQCNVRVTRIERLAPGQGCRVVVDDGAGTSPRTLQADVVLCATEGARAGALLQEADPQERQLFGAVRYNALGVLHLALSGDLPPLLEFAPRHAATRIATWQQTPAREGTPALLYCQLTPEAVQEARDQGMTDRLQALLADELRRRIPGVEGRVLHAVNQWIDCKLPVFYPGYGRQVAAFLQWQAAAPRAVYHCGDYLAQSLLNGACRSGSDAAATIVGHWSPT